MLTEQDVFQLFEDYRGQPAAAEAGYLVGHNLRPETISTSLRYRYGDGQGYVQFKADLSDLAGVEIDDQTRRFKFEDDDGDTREVDKITLDDVRVPLDQTLRVAFEQTVEQQLRERLRDEIVDLSPDAKLLAGIARRGYDIGLWEQEAPPHRTTDLFTLTTGEPVNDKEEQIIYEELYEAGVLYYSNDHLTPMLRNLENPYEYLRQPIPSE